ncbi:MAG TPA: Mur ligase family protein [Steroidobacteraceae bacterium]|nr:Mur ligase family protein [Steroidobacteraceae bacterium]
MGVAVDAALIGAWRTRVRRAAAHLGWNRVSMAERLHRGGTTLAISAPPDQLLLATEVNEWALCAALLERDPQRCLDLERSLVAAFRAARTESPPDGDAGPDPALEESAALARFAALAALEARPGLRSLLDAADRAELPFVLDDSALTLGGGIKSLSFPLDALPSASEVPWHALAGVPTAIVTGSNGKTTTVRVLAACARAHGWHTAYSCTDGVFLDDETLAAGDYSGPAGARIAMREPRAEAAILETARGGILRRGIAVNRADAAVVTNVSADHFGEYGIHDLDGLAEAKLTVAYALGPRGLLVLNADDPALCARAGELERRAGRAPRVAWFSVDPSGAALDAHRRRGAWICGPRGGHLQLELAHEGFDLGGIDGLPLSVDGTAVYNVANLAGAALAAAALGIAPGVIAAVFARFGAEARDNPGRMMRFERNGVRILVDYAHNPDGLKGLLEVAQAQRDGTGRLGLVLGHAGNRSDADIEALARAAADFRPDLIVIKENEQYLRGREAGEIPRVIRAELERQGFDSSALPFETSEVAAVRHALAWARPGDVLALPVHSTSARAEVLAMLERR